MHVFFMQKNTALLILNSLDLCLFSITFGQKLHHKSGPEDVKLFLCSTQFSMRFVLLTDIKMQTTVGILKFINRKKSC